MLVDCIDCRECLDTTDSNNNKQETEVCSNMDCSCTLTYADYTGGEGVSPDKEGVIGYIEKDGLPGFTSQDEAFHLNDTFPDGVTVYMLRPACRDA
jgi:hypothetical protein